MSQLRIHTLETQAGARSYFCARFSSARASALADSEGAEPLIFAIEELGRYLSGQSKALEQTSKALITWYSSKVPRRSQLFEDRLALLRRGRNDKMHKGFAARNLTKDAVAVALMLEDALKTPWHRLTARDVMTSPPTIAATWMTFGTVRDLLIENSYSQVPIQIDSAWKVISERRIAAASRLARSAEDADIRDHLLTDSPAMLQGRSLLTLLAEDATLVPEGESVLNLDLQAGCVLVHRAGANSDLVGIVTPSDVA